MMFVKVHDSYSNEVIVNIDYVESVARLQDGEALIGLISGEQIRTEERYSDVVTAVRYRREI